MTKAEIITKFNLFMDDTSELSSVEESDLFDKVYRRINSDRPWEGTKQEATTTTSTTVPYVDLEDNFLFLTANYNYTENNFEAGMPVVFRGSNFSPYKVVSWSDRRRYRDNEGVAYIDVANSRLYFTKQPTSVEPVEYDYHGQATALTDTDSPWFPAEYHDVIYHFMCVESFIIQQSPKAKSYMMENIKMGEDILERMQWWNSNLVQI